MDNWTYRCYNDNQAKTLWQRWYTANKAYRGEHDFVFDFLEQQDVWRGTKCRPLKGKPYKGLIEVRLTQGDVQHRIFGCYAKDKRRVFVVLGTGIHKDKVYTPKKVLDTMVKRKKALENGNATAPVCNRPQ